MLVLKGRPKDTSGRQDREIRVYDHLDSLGIEYYRVDHSEAKTMDDCEAIDVALETVMCKNLVLCNRQHTQFYLLMMPANKPFKTKDVSHMINSARLSFAEPEYLEKFLDVLPGSVSIMGLINDTDNNIQLLVDREVMGPDFVGCHPCANTTSLKIPTADVFGKYLESVHHTPIILDIPRSEE
ncbi:MAG: prolyl-tRNA synthetase associated domain-containing protein [Clostridia bacterium]|nr:prolyl-tRNA synthetase associated domain-containing protein [Clostridia bacterium]